MSLVIDFYKGNGEKTEAICFKSNGTNRWYFKFFRLTICKVEMDVLEYMAYLVNNEERERN